MSVQIQVQIQVPSLESEFLRIQDACVVLESLEDEGDVFFRPSRSSRRTVRWVWKILFYRRYCGVRSAVAWDFLRKKSWRFLELLGRYYCQEALVRLGLFFLRNVRLGQGKVIPSYNPSSRIFIPGVYGITLHDFLLDGSMEGWQCGYSEVGSAWCLTCLPVMHPCKHGYFRFSRRIFICSSALLPSPSFPGWECSLSGVSGAGNAS